MTQLEPEQLGPEEIANAKVGTLAAEYPASTRVFARHGIDYCCGGGRPLREACERRGVDVKTVVDEVRLEIAGGPRVGETDWTEAPLSELTRHIVQTYHEPLAEELPRLELMARKVHRVHGDNDPERLSELLSVYLALQAELREHMAKEEDVLFPLIERGQGAIAGAPVSVMRHEHDEAAYALGRIRELTDDYRAPAGACTTWRALWHGLEALEQTMRDHIHLENNILFPRALDS